MALRLCLLNLFKALILPSCADSDTKAPGNANENGVAFVEAGGVQLLADLVAGMSWSRQVIDA